MFDIGIGEILALGVIGLLVFGPDRLPKAAADAGKWVRQIRGMAVSARKDLVDSAGIDMSDSMDSLKELRDLHPRNIAASLFKDDDTASAPTARSGAESGAADNGSASSSGGVAPKYDPDLT